MINSLLRKIFIQIIFLLGIFMLMRTAFVYHNRDIQPIGQSIWENIVILYWGVRYDLSSILIFLSPVFLLTIITYLTPPSGIRKAINRITKVVYFSITVILTSIMLMDVAFFRFNGRRATVEVFDILGYSKSAFLSFLKGYSEFVVFFGVTILVLLFLYKKLAGKSDIKLSRNQWIITIAVISLIYFFGIGTKKTPLQPKTASYYVNPKFTAIVTNTPQTLLYSIYKNQKVLETKKYMDDKEARNYAPIIQYINGEKSTKKNVVIFVLESFSREYLVDGNVNRAYTPFLDSLMEKSTLFEDAYANATTSTYGLMCILGGLPAFMDEPYFSSIYSQNKFLGIGEILKKEGYTNSFFFGAENDHFGFKKKMALLGIDNYYSQESMEDYEKYYDNAWGVYDDKYFEFAANTLKNQPKPFFATIFNISSHYPYKIPKNIEINLADGRLPSHQSITYVDYSLKKFFKKVSKEPWYNETVFFFIADHWAKIPGIIENSMVGKYQIPAFMHIPSEPNKVIVNELFQQLDVVPTLLDVLGYKGSVMSFGKSIFNTNEPYRYTINEYESIYQIIDKEYVLTYNEKLEKSTSLYKYIDDKKLLNNILLEEPERAQTMEKYVKANIQQYNNSLINNKLHP